MSKCSSLKTSSGFIFLNCDFFIDNLFKDLNGFIEINNLSEKDKKKLTFHYFTTYLIKLSNTNFNHYSPVFFITKDKINTIQDILLKPITHTIQLFSKMLPVPFITVCDDIIFHRKNGELKELEQNVSNFYIKRKSNTIKLRKYLQEEEFYDLIRVLQDIRNIKTIIN